MSDEDPILKRDQVSQKYAAFIDILGVSDNILGDFDSTLETQEQIIRSTGIVTSLIPEVQLRMYSDSYLLTSDSLQRLVAATQALLMQTLMNDRLVRGGIAHGKHVEASQPPHFFMASEAVVKAVQVEKNVKYPCVAIHSDIKVEDGWWGDAPSNLDRGLLYFGGLVIVNPCNRVWGMSAATRVMQMLENYPQHRPKYDWFLELHQAIFSPIPMVPPRFFDSQPH
jgi:hypothetical protein